MTRTRDLLCTSQTLCHHIIPLRTLMYHFSDQEYKFFNSKVYILPFLTSQRDMVLSYDKVITYAMCSPIILLDKKNIMTS